MCVCVFCIRLTHHAAEQQRREGQHAVAVGGRTAPLSAVLFPFPPAATRLSLSLPLSITFTFRYRFARLLFRIALSHSLLAGFLPTVNDIFIEEKQQQGQAAS